MKFEFVRVTKPIRLAEYTEELSEEIRVWVNVPRTVIEQVKNFGTMSDAEIFTWLNGVWGPECPVEDIQKLFEQCRENDPALWRWLIEQTLEKIFDYRVGIKKA